MSVDERHWWHSHSWTMEQNDMRLEITVTDDLCPSQLTTVATLNQSKVWSHLFASVATVQTSQLLMLLLELETRYEELQEWLESPLERQRKVFQERPVWEKRTTWWPSLLYKSWTLTKKSQSTGSLQAWTLWRDTLKQPMWHLWTELLQHFRMQSSFWLTLMRDTVQPWLVWRSWLLLLKEQTIFTVLTNEYNFTL